MPIFYHTPMTMTTSCTEFTLLYETISAALIVSFIVYHLGMLFF